MAKLEGIIYNAFSGYVVLRGYAQIGELAELSRKPDSYQRNPDDQHKKEIVDYLLGTKSYFPEITLACRVKDYEGLIQSIGDDKDGSAEDSKYVKGLRVLSERVNWKLGQRSSMSRLSAMTSRKEKESSYSMLMSRV